MGVKNDWVYLSKNLEVNLAHCPRDYIADCNMEANYDKADRAFLRINVLGEANIEWSKWHSFDDEYEEDNLISAQLPTYTDLWSLRDWLNENKDFLNEVASEANEAYTNDEGGYDATDFNDRLETKLAMEVDEFDTVLDSELEERILARIENTTADSIDELVESVRKSNEIIRDWEHEDTELASEEGGYIIAIEHLENGGVVSSHELLNDICEKHLNSQWVDAERTLNLYDQVARNGLDLNDVAIEGGGVLHAYDNQPAVFQGLLERGVDINAQRWDGDTALHTTYTEEVAKILLDNGADLSVVNENGFTPYERQKERGNDSIAELIYAKQCELDRQEMSQAIEEHLDTWTPSNVDGEAMQRDVAGLEAEEQEVVFERRESRGRKM